MNDGRPKFGHRPHPFLNINLAKVRNGTSNRPVFDEPDSRPGVGSGGHFGTDTELALVKGKLLARGHLGTGGIL